MGVLHHDDARLVLDAARRGDQTDAPHRLQPAGDRLARRQLPHRHRARRLRAHVEVGAPRPQRARWLPRGQRARDLRDPPVGARGTGARRRRLVVVDDPRRPLRPRWPRNRLPLRDGPGRRGGGGFPGGADLRGAGHQRHVGRGARPGGPRAPAGLRGARRGRGARGGLEAARARHGPGLRGRDRGAPGGPDISPLPRARLPTGRSGRQGARGRRPPGSRRPATAPRRRAAAGTHTRATRNTDTATTPPHHPTSTKE